MIAKKKMPAKKVVPQKKVIVNDKLKQAIGNHKKPMSMSEKLDFISALKTGANKRPPMKRK